MKKGFCPSCYTPFSIDNPPFSLLNCQHHLCKICLSALEECPLDNITILAKTNLLKSDFPIDEELLSQINLRRSLENLTKIGNDQNLDVSLNQFDKSISYQNEDQSQKTDSLKDDCSKHKKPLQLICLDDNQVICPNCALFGQHKGHHVQNKESFFKKLTDLSEKVFGICVKIRNNQKYLKKQFLFNEFKQRCILQKDSKINSIKQQFTTLKLAVQNAQLEAIEQVQNIYNKLSKKYQYPDFQFAYEKCINSWFKKVQNMSDVIQNNESNLKSLTQCSIYINSLKQKDNVITQGQNIDSQLFKYIKQVKELNDKKVNKLDINYNFEILDDIAKFCHIRCKQNKKMRKISNKQNQIQQSSQKTARRYESIFKEMVIPQFDQNQEYLLQRQIPVQDVKPFGFEQTNNHSLSQISMIKSGVTEDQRVQQSKTNIFDETIPLKSYESRIVDDRNSFTNIKMVSSVDLSNRFSFNSNQKPRINLLSSNRSPLREKNMNSSIISSRDFSVKKIVNIGNANKTKKLIQQLKADKLQKIDLSNLQMGDKAIIQFCQHIKKSKKLKSLKLMRNKLSQQSFQDIIEACRESNVVSLNLSHNLFTQKIFSTLNKYTFYGRLKTITLSINKINAKVVKNQIQSMNKKGVKIVL